MRVASGGPRVQHGELGTGPAKARLSSGFLQTPGVKLLAVTDTTRPTAGEAGRLIFNTTTLELQVDDGTSWIPFSTAATIVKAADETVTSSSTLQDDDHLKIAVVANAIYLFSLYITFFSNTSRDIKFAFDVPSGTTIQGNTTSATILTAIVDVDLTSAQSMNSASSVGDCIFMLTGRIVVSSTAGDIQFQWAQVSAGSPGTIVRRGSALILNKIP